MQDAVEGRGILQIKVANNDVSAGSTAVRRGIESNDNGQLILVARPLTS